MSKVITEYDDRIESLENTVNFVSQNPDVLAQIQKLMNGYKEGFKKVPHDTSYKSVGKFYMTKPFKNRSLETQVKGRFADVVQVNELTELELLADYPDKGADRGDKLLVRGENFNAPWAKQVLKAGDLEFILVPEDFGVLLVKG